MGSLWELQFATVVMEEIILCQSILVEILICVVFQNDKLTRIMLKSREILFCLINANC